MDFIEGFPKVDGKSVVLTVVDRFSKFAHFIVLRHPYSAASVAKAFFEDIARLHGIPCSIVSGRDTVFTSAFWTELFKMTGTKLQMSSAFHPQLDSQSEVVNTVLTMYLHCLAGDRPKAWLQWLPWAKFCYNTSYQTTLKCSPFKVVYDRDPPTMISYQHGASKVAAVDQQLMARYEFLTDIRRHLIQSQVTMKEYQDQKWQEVLFQEGDWVWLKLQQRTTMGVTPATHSKLGPKYYGLYKILQKIGSVAYKLQLPNHARIHDVFHILLLKRYDGPLPNQVVSLPAILHGKVLPSLEKIVWARLNRGVWELLVKWTGRLDADTTWKQLEDFKQQFPCVELTDELFVGKGANVVDAFVGLKYQQRPRVRKEHGERTQS
jgi:hypothetical protein